VGKGALALPTKQALTEIGGHASLCPPYDPRHARACPEQPRLSGVARKKTWMAGMNPAMTAVSIQLGQPL
jgi:hypothetical protein